MRAREVLREAARTYRRHRLRLVAIGLVLYGGLTTLTAALLYVLPREGFAVAAPFWLASIFWLQGAVARALEAAQLEEGRVSVRESLRRGTWERINALGAAGLLAVLGIFAALLFALVPGVFLLVRWALVAQVIALEASGTFRSFGRSWELVEGRSWHVFWLLAFVLVVLFGGWALIFLAVDAYADVLGDAGALATFAVVTLLFFSVTAPFLAAAMTVAYARLRAEAVPATRVEWSFRVGDVLDEAWRLYRTHPVRLAVVGAAVFVPLVALGSGLGAVHPALSAGAAFLGVLGLILLPGLLAPGVGEDFAESRPRGWFRGVWRSARPRLLRMLVASAVVTVAVAAGTVVLVVGGFVVLTFWSLVTIAIALEGRSLVVSFGRSRELVSGSGARVFAVICLSALVALLLVLLASPYLPYVPLPGVLLGLLVATIAQSIAAPFIALTWIAMYGELTRIHIAWAARHQPPPPLEWRPPAAEQ